MAEKNFERLEEQLCAFASDGYTGKGSPDRADAMVWAISELMLGTGTVQMFPDFRAVNREKEPSNALHVVPPAALQDWWPRWVSASCGHDSAAHWFCREPNGRIRIYRELAMRDTTPEEFGAAIAERSQVESGATRMVPVWLSEKAFDRTAGKSIAASIYQGIERSLGEHRAFLFVHTETERTVEDPARRIQMIDARLANMPRGFLSVQAVRSTSGKDQVGWDTVREMLRWRDRDRQAKPEQPDWDHARELAATDPSGYQDYIRGFMATDGPPLPLLLISNECRVLIQAMSGASRSATDDSALAQNSGSYALHSLRIGCLASREDQGTEPMDSFIGKRLSGMGEDASPISRHLVAQRAQGEWSQRFSSKPLSFRRVRR